MIAEKILSDLKSTGKVNDKKILVALHNAGIIDAEKLLVEAIQNFKDSIVGASPEVKRKKIGELRDYIDLYEMLIPESEVARQLDAEEELKIAESHVATVSAPKVVSANG